MRQPDAHLNPAVTLGVAVAPGDFSKFVPYFAMPGAGRNRGRRRWCGCTICRIGGRRRIRTRKLACFSTGPAIRNFAANLMSEIIGTFVLVLVGSAIFAKAVAGRARSRVLGPYLVGSLVWGIGLSLGGTTGYAINPARDLGPRIAHAILPIAGKGQSDWGYSRAYTR